MAANACNRCGCAFGQCECLEANDEVPFSKNRERHSDRITRVYKFKKGGGEEKPFVLERPFR